MKRLAIIGSGDLGQQIAYHALTDRHYEPVGFFDDYQDAGSTKHGLKILGSVKDVEDKFRDGVFDFLMIGVGYKHLSFRKTLYNQFKDKIPFGTVTHSSSYIDPSCKIGSGVFIYPGCILDMNTVIHDNVLLNVGCIIAHDSTIGLNSFLSPGVKVAGFVSIASEVILGIGTVVIDNITISSGVRTAGGAVVIDNLDESGLYVGVPAKIKKTL
jgi:sugar O-acyltransferase (sialic acid O-acetyltransferase NeuD family)